MTFKMMTISILKNIHIKGILRFGFFLNIYTIVILMRIYHTHDDVFNYGRTIENINKTGNSLNICFKRYLAEYEGETEINKTGLYKNSPYYFENKGTSNYDSYASIYGSIKNRDSKKLKLYKTAYNHRYAKKKGLSKLDCYYENKIFKKIDHLYDIAYNWRGDKKSFKKKIMKVFGTRLILFALLPCLGLILLILFGSKDIGRGILKVCSGTDETHVGDSATCDGIHNFITQDTLNYIQYTNFVFSLLMVIIVILFFTYILLKVIKYEKLEEGKGKMNKKQYINYCKEVFNLK